MNGSMVLQIRTRMIEMVSKDLATMEVGLKLDWLLMLCKFNFCLFFLLGGYIFLEQGRF